MRLIKFELSGGDELHISPDKIDYVYVGATLGGSRVSVIHVNGEKHAVSQTPKEIEEMIKDHHYGTVSVYGSDSQ